MTDPRRCHNHHNMPAYEVNYSLSTDSTTEINSYEPSSDMRCVPASDPLTSWSNVLQDDRQVLRGPQSTYAAASHDSDQHYIQSDVTAYPTTTTAPLNAMPAFGNFIGFARPGQDQAPLLPGSWQYSYDLSAHQHDHTQALHQQPCQYRDNRTQIPTLARVDAPLSMPISESGMLPLDYNATLAVNAAQDPTATSESAPADDSFSIAQYLSMPDPTQPINMLADQHRLSDHPSHHQHSFQAQYNGIFNPSDFAAPALGAHAPATRQSPTSSSLEVCSVSGSDSSWAAINMPNVSYTSINLPAYPTPPIGAVFSPGHALRLRSQSGSSGENQRPRRQSDHSDLDELPFTGHVRSSDYANQNSVYQNIHEVPPACPIVARTTIYTPPADDSSSSSALSPCSASAWNDATIVSAQGFPDLATDTTPRRLRKGQQDKSASTSKVSKSFKTSEKTHAVTAAQATTDRRIGRRMGPLRPEQREQARETRKRRACLRCKFLKKTCSGGTPCGACFPHHVRLWQVPCTRLDIKELGYFLKDFTCDYERDVGTGKRVENIIGFGPENRTLYITHGYGHLLPVSAREVYVKDERCFKLQWTERVIDDPSGPDTNKFRADTYRLSVGAQGVNLALLSEYLDNHIEKGFAEFLDLYLLKTPYYSEILHTAHRYYMRTRTASVRKALKMFLAYTLTLHVTFCEGMSDEEASASRIKDPNSHCFDFVCAPAMINFQVKCALAAMWRDLHKDVLEHLSTLYTSVYQGDKLRHWPTIFVLATILLSVWELMQFDVNFRAREGEEATKFCAEMDDVPVGVIVGLFQAISTRLPNMADWDTSQHAALLNNDPYICETLTEIRGHVRENNEHLRSRNDCKFDRDNFDCLSNKLLSKLVIRAN